MVNKVLPLMQLIQIQLKLLSDFYVSIQMDLVLVDKYLLQLETVGQRDLEQVEMDFFDVLWQLELIKLTHKLHLQYDDVDNWLL
jgi:hypothetical protein